MASQLATLCKDLSASGLIRIVREQFSKITDTRRQASILFTLPDTLCAALAMFLFKWPSLLQFDGVLTAGTCKSGVILWLTSSPRTSYSMEIPDVSSNTVVQPHP